MNSHMISKMSDASKYLKHIRYGNKSFSVSSSWVSLDWKVKWYDWQSKCKINGFVGLCP